MITSSYYVCYVDSFNLTDLQSPGYSQMYIVSICKKQFKDKNQAKENILSLIFLSLN